MLSVASVACSTLTERYHPHPTPPHAQRSISARRVQLQPNVNIPTPPHPMLSVASVACSTSTER